MIYVGCYLVATLPSRQIEVYDSCPKCGLKSNTPFCPFDGASVPTKFVEEPVCLDEVFENVDADGNEMFAEWKNINLLPKIDDIGVRDSIITISPYHKPTSRIRYSWVDDFCSLDNQTMCMPEFDFSIDNWGLLLKALTNEKIYFRREFGVVTIRESFVDMPY